MTFLGAFLKFRVYILRFAAYNFGWNFRLNFNVNCHGINTKITMQQCGRASKFGL